MLISSNFRKTKYFRKDELDWDERSSSGRYVKQHCKKLKVRRHTDINWSSGDSNCLFQKYCKSTEQAHVELFDLIGKLLDFEPAKRISAGEALRHPFFHVHIPPTLL